MLQDAAPAITGGHQAFLCSKEWQTHSGVNAGDCKRRASCALKNPVHAAGAQHEDPSSPARAGNRAGWRRWRARMQLTCRSEETSSNYPSMVSGPQKTKIEAIHQALGSRNAVAENNVPTFNPNPPQSAAPVKVSAEVAAPWHNIARPESATCAVSQPPLHPRLCSAPLQRGGAQGCCWS